MVHYLKDSFFADKTNLQNFVSFVEVTAIIVKYCGVENRLRMGVGQMRSPSLNVVQCMLLVTLQLCSYESYELLVEQCVQCQCI